MITTDDVKGLAKLARIEIKDDEAVSLTKEIDSILEYVGQIKTFSSDEVKQNPILKNVMREDEPTNFPGEYTEDILKNAPKRQGNFVEVKNIL